jgi:ABC-type multidrug transport system fused ATPase/permease subunit
MPFAPSHTETLVLFQLPLFISLALAVLLLFSRKFAALAGAILAFVLYIAVATSALGSIVGAMLLLFSGWAAVAFLTVPALRGSRRSSASSPTVRHQPTSVDRTTPGPQLGQCPNCNQAIPLACSKCAYCGALFTEGAAWKVKQL